MSSSPEPISLFAHVRAKMVIQAANDIHAWVDHRPAEWFIARGEFIAALDSWGGAMTDEQIDAEILAYLMAIKTELERRGVYVPDDPIEERNG